MAKDVILQQKIERGQYETLYPKTRSNQIEGLLSNETREKFGLSGESVPDDVFDLLSRFNSGLGNEYVWEKKRFIKIPEYTQYNGTVITSYINFNHLYVSNKYHIENNVMVLDDPEHHSYENLQYISWGYNMSMIPVGAYAQFTDSSTYAPTTNSPTYKVNEDTTFTMNPYSIVASNISKLINIRDGYEIVGYVNSPDPNAYPPSISDDCIYTALGQLGAKVSITAGSYIGSGTSGASNPNTLTFDFEPKVLIIFQITAYYKPMIMTSGEEGTSFIDNPAWTTSNKLTWSNNNKTVSWYNENNNAYYQCNTTGSLCKYVAIS